MKELIYFSLSLYYCWWYWYKSSIYFTDSYKYYIDQGFLPSLDSECTYCIENPLSIDDVNSIIDHILVRPPANENKKYSAEVWFGLLKQNSKRFSFISHYCKLSTCYIRCKLLIYNMLSQCTAWLYHGLCSTTCI